MRSFVLTATASAAILFAVGPVTAQPAPEPPPTPIPYSAVAAAPEASPAPKPAAPPRRIAPAAPPPSAPATPGVRLQAGQPLPTPELEAFVDGRVGAAMAGLRIAGVAVAIVQDGQVVMSKGYGSARLAPNRPVDPQRTLFRLGEVSQAFTWIGLMKQVEAGRIQLDRPVNLYLPERVQVRDQGYERPVRVLDLMDHAAGFEARGDGHLYERDPDFVRPLELHLRRERAGRVREPGRVASLSSYGPALAGAAIAYAGGETFERFMETQVFIPMGLSRTTFREPRPVKAALPAPMPAALAADVADGFRWKAGSFVRQPYEFAGHVAPAASASSTASDMARLMLVLLTNGQAPEGAVYGAATAKAFRTPILRTPPGVNGWAHGFAVETLPGGRRGYGASGATPSFAAHMVTVPQLGLGVFVAANSASGRELAETLPSAIVGAFYARPQPFPPEPSSALASHAGAFEGRYLSTRRAYGGLEGFIGLLTSASTVRVTAQGRLLTTGLGGETRSWTPSGAPETGDFVSDDRADRISFRMQDGRAVSFLTSDGAELYERIGFWRSTAALWLAAGLTGLAAALTLAGAARRDRREIRQSQIQNRGSLVQNLQAGLWLLSFALFAAWAWRIRDPARLAFDWPGSLLVTASACALVAACLTITTLVALPAVWRGGRRVESWPLLRKAAFSATVIIYALLATLLARSGALSLWAG